MLFLQKLHKPTFLGMVTLTYNLNTSQTEAGCKFEAILSYMSPHQQNSREI